MSEEPLTRRQRRALLLRLTDEQGGLCAYCDVPMVTETRHHRMATLDHVESVDAGGVDDETNFVAACHQCNRAKGCMTLDQLKRLVARIEALPPSSEIGRG